MRRGLDATGALRPGPGRRLAAWSFHPRKLLTTGEGGMLTTRDADWPAARGGCASTA